MLAVGCGKNTRGNNRTYDYVGSVGWLRINRTRMRTRSHCCVYSFWTQLAAVFEVMQGVVLRRVRVVSRF